MSAVGVLLCAGGSSRMGFDKLLAVTGGKNAIERCRDALILGGVERLVLVGSESNATYLHQLPCAVPACVVMGGECRTQSVRNALEAECAHWQADDIAVIHDCARCMIDPYLVQACIESAVLYGSGVAAIPLTDTVLRFEQHGELSYLTEKAQREGLFRMQTPQAFRYERILRAHRLADAPATDDSTLYARNCGLPVALVAGSEDNRKLTTPADMQWLRERLACTKYGTGYDSHRLVEGRELILGGVNIPFEKGLLGHSDADVLLHAICDALLGACALGDIGQHFSDKDPRYKGIDSRVLLRECVNMVQKRDIQLANIDATIIAERPKLAPYTELMRRNIASDCGISVDCVSIKATTTEGMNDEGRGLCISASAIAALRCLI